MTLSDRTLEHLATVADRPVVSGSRYEILDRLGQGGMGTVYRARDLSLGREVALKVLSAPWIAGADAGRLLKEAQILARLEHPGIVPVHDVGTLADGRAFYAMRRVQGRRLDVARAASPPLPDLLRMFYRVCETVAYAHAHGILHRDLKPQNIMIGPFGEVLLIDWGVAKLLRGQETPEAGSVPAAPGADGDTLPGTVVGTLGYMAPEQAAGEVALVDERTDVFGLGAVLHFLLEGRPPPERGAAAVPAPLRSIAAKATTADPAARYQSASELMADLARYADGEPVLAHPESIARRAGRVVSRYRVAIALVLAYLAMRGALLLFRGV